MQSLRRLLRMDDRALEVAFHAYVDSVETRLSRAPSRGTKQANLRLLKRRSDDIRDRVYKLEAGDTFAALVEATRLQLSGGKTSRQYTGLDHSIGNIFRRSGAYLNAFGGAPVAE